MEALRRMPPVNDVLRHGDLFDLASILGQPFVSKLLGEVMEQERERLRSDGADRSREELTRAIAAELRRRIEDFLKPSIRRVINATGVILHTNLGRAPLPSAAIDHLKDAAVGYSNVEFALEEGGRGLRDDHIAPLINALLGSESALVVNNNAAGVLLVLNSLAEGGEVLVSRGEEVEIGGSFRIPEVMQKSGARLREIGTTNRTRIEDYRVASGGATRLLLRVHPSNFKMMGFTERPSLEEFVELGQELGVPTFEDMGSGCLSELPNAAIAGEPRPADSIRAGVDIVSFSADKLMGGPQAGIVAGRKAHLQRIRRNPLFRALRVDKLTLSVLEVVLQMHLRGEVSEIPVLRMLTAEEAGLRDRAETLASRVNQPVLVPVPLKSVVGGGSLPAAEISSWGLALALQNVSPVEIERRFRQETPPVVVRIEHHHVLMDLRTVSRDEEEALLRAISAVIG